MVTPDADRRTRGSATCGRPYHRGMPASPRSVTEILDELATVERYLVDAPPHSGSGHREHLAQRVGELRRELAAARASGPGRTPGATDA